MRHPDAYDDEFWSQYLASRHAPCPACGYDLRGGRTAVCPECGHITSLGELRTFADPSEEGWYVNGGWGLTAAALAGIAPAGVAVCYGAVMIFRGGAALVGSVFLCVGMCVIAVPLLAARWWQSGARRLRSMNVAIRNGLVLVWWTLALINLALSLTLLCALVVELVRLVTRP